MEYWFGENRKHFQSKGANERGKACRNDVEATIIESVCRGADLLNLFAFEAVESVYSEKGCCCKHGRTF